MYDGIEQFYYAPSYDSLYQLCTAYRFKDIKTLTNKSAKSTLELIHLIKTSLFSAKSPFELIHLIKKIVL